jgi:hypothetical protein
VWLNNVNLLVRLLHIPTTQPLFFAAVNNPTQISADFSALLFSIYFAAVTSIDDSETNVILGQDRQSALNAYQYGLELSLHMAGFLDYPTISSIQAMSMYLVCLFMLHELHTVTNFHILRCVAGAITAVDPDGY